MLCLAALSDIWNSFSDWAVGRDAANPGGYHTLWQCMSGDTFWIALTVMLDIAVAAGYVLIAYHWYANQRTVAVRSPARVALLNMRNIFLFCGLCGYLFIPIKMIWPAWRVYDVFLAILVFYTWRYAWNATSLKVIYSELERSAQLSRDLEASRAESQRKTFFLNAVSHDLRTPLNGIVLQAHMADAAARSNDLATMQKSLAEIKASAKLTGDVLNALLQYAKLESEPINPTTFHLNDLLTHIQSSFRAMAEAKGLALEVHETPGSDALFLDRSKLERIVMNLVDNAIKFTLRGTITLAGDVRDGALILTVRDTGVGIDQEHQTHLFQEFFQVDNVTRDRTRGVGLGLAITRRLVEQIGGTVDVESTPGVGSIFSVRVPAAAATTLGTPATQGVQRLATDALPG